MGLSKRLVSVLLVILCIVHLAPPVSAEEAVVHSVYIFSDQLYDVNVVDMDGTIFVRAEDLARVYGGKLRYIDEIDRWSLPGAGDRLALFKTSGDGWITVETGMHDGTLNRDALFQFGNYHVHAEVKDAVVELEDGIYVDLLETICVLGGYLMDGEGYLHLMIPRMNEREFYYFACDIMGEYAPLAVTTWRSKDDSQWDRAWQNIGLIADMTLDIISEGKVWEVVSETYEDEYVEEVLVASMSVTPMYTMAEVEDAWELVETCYKVMSNKKIYAMDQNGTLFSKSDEIFVKVFVDENVLEEYEKFLISDGLQVTMGVTGIVMNCMFEAERIGNMASSNIDLCKNVFIDNKKYVNNDTIHKIAKKVLKKYDSPAYIVHDAVLHNIASNSAEYAYEIMANIINKGASSCMNLISQIRLALEVDLKLIEHVYNYNYGEAVIVQEYYKLQRALRGACINAGNGNLPENEKLAYMHDCLQFFAHVKEASLRNTNETLTIKREGSDAWEDYLEIMSILPEEIAFADYDFAKEKICVSANDVRELFDKEPPVIENGEVVNEFNRLVQQIDLGLALLGVNENEWGFVKEANICNLDGDADLELIVELANSTDFAYERRDRAYLVLDGSSQSAHLFKSDDLCRNCTELVRSTADNAVYLRVWCDVQDSYQIYYYKWSGTEWLEYAYFWEEHWDLISEITVPAVFTMAGETLTRDAWEKFDGNLENISDEVNPLLSEYVRNKIPSSAKCGIEYPELRSFFLAGNADEIISKYASVVSSRADYVCSASGDIGAGGESTIFILRDTQNRWLENIVVDKANEKYTDFRTSLEVNAPLYMIDYAVIATPVENGVTFDIVTFHFDPNGIEIDNIFVEDGLLYSGTGSFQSTYKLVMNTEKGIADLVFVGMQDNESADIRSILNRGYWVLGGVNNALNGAVLSFGPDVVYIWGKTSYEAGMAILEDGSVAIYFDFVHCRPSETPVIFIYAGSVFSSSDCYFAEQ